MTWQVIWSDRARRDLLRLDRQVAARVLRAVERLATEQGGDVQRLRGYRDVWRLRVGDWRVRFRYDYSDRTLHVQGVLRRDEAYRD